MNMIDAMAATIQAMAELESERVRTPPPCRICRAPGAGTVPIKNEPYLVCPGCADDVPVNQQGSEDAA